MKTLICENDLKKGSLCKECSKKLEEGKITELEVKISKKLYALDKKFFFLDLELKGAIEVEDIVILLCKGNIGQLIGKGGKIIGEISKEIGKKCRIVGVDKDEKQVAQDLFGNVRVIGLNKIYNLGNLEYVVIIKKDDEKNLNFKINSLEKILEKILGAKTKIEFM
ncbi:MAG: transcription elongation factor NusA [Candidatus Diapherotrites archaeon]|nr:transcription elongation factor NusA [Candidatus Diapherotrites archaeon]